MEIKKEIVCIVQARMGSSRLPAKIFLKLSGKPVLFHVIARLKKSKLITKIVAAVPDSKNNDCIEEYVNLNFPDVGIFRGSENDVLDRYYKAAKLFKGDVIIRITSDCPLIDSEIVDKVVSKLLETGADYSANIFHPRTYPRGFDCEAMTMEALQEVWQKANAPSDREHVTTYLRSHPEQFKCCKVESNKDYSKFRITLDEDKDYEFLKQLFNYLPENSSFLQIVAVLEARPRLAKINQEALQKHANV